MRIAYICYWPAFRPDGVSYKINDQVARWLQLGHQAQVFCISPAPDVRTPAVFDGPVYEFASVAERARGTIALMRDVERFRPDCIYLRDDQFLPPLAWTLFKHPSAIEINGDLDELRSWDRLPALAYAVASYQITLRCVSGLVFVSHELSRSPHFRAGRRRPRVVIANGADPERIRHLPAPANERPRFVLLAGAATPWQGLDKVVWLARHMPDADFELVGPKVSAFDEPLPDNVTAHGMLSKEDYEPIMARSDVALGSLAMHRRGHTENPSLKVREYLLAGLPVINSCDDTDFMGDHPWYLLRLPNTETNVRDHVEGIRSFADSVRGQRVPRELVIHRVGNAAKEARRLEFLEELVRSSRR